MVFIFSNNLASFGLNRPVVRTTRCGRVNLGSIPSLDSVIDFHKQNFFCVF